MKNILAICLAMIDNEEDQNKFEIVYNRYRKLLYHVAKGKLSDEEYIEEAVCTAFLRIAKNMSLIREPVSDETMHLLIIITRRAAIDIIRRQRRKKIDTVSWDTLEDMEFLSVEMQIDESNSITDAIAALPNQYRDVLVLKYAYGYSNDEVARFLNFTVVNVEKITSRGKQKLKTILKQKEVQDNEAER